MNAQEILNQLLAADGQEWFLTKTDTGRAAITTVPEGTVVGKIECHQPEKNSSGDSVITAQTLPDAKSSDECEPHVLSLR